MKKKVNFYGCKIGVYSLRYLILLKKSGGNILNMPPVCKLYFF